jgi:hypothetical protein
VLPPSFVQLPEIRTPRDLTGTRLMPIRDRAREWQRPAVMADGMQTAAKEAHHAGGSLMFAAAASPWVLGGLAVFAVFAMAWLGVLSRVPLSVAYPFNALGFIAISASRWPAARR